MVLQKKDKKLAQFLLKKLAHASFLAILFVPGFSLFATGSSLPIIIPEDELPASIQLAYGVVSVVTVSDSEELLGDSSSSLPCEEFQMLRGEMPETTFSDSGLSETNWKFHGEVRQANSQIPNRISEKTELGVPAGTSENFAFYGEGAFQNDPNFLGSGLLSQNSKALLLEQFSLNSIANLSPVAFLGICLNPSELPSKNLPTQCGSFLSKSTIQKFAKDSISLWQRVKTTSLWPRSTNCLPIQNPSIQERFLNHTPSMSDISFIWLREMADSQVSLGLVLGMGKTKTTPVAKLIA